MMIDSMVVFDIFIFVVKVVVNYYKEYWNEEDCQYCCGYYFVYYIGIYCVLCVGISISIDNQWYNVEDKCQ